MIRLISFSIIIFFTFVIGLPQVKTANAQSYPHNGEILLDKQTISLNKRYPIASVNQVFKDNILLTLAYLNKKEINPSRINWNMIEKPTRVRIILLPGQTFAFDNDVFADYKSSLAHTTNAHFNASEGFKSDGYLYGDGVCHLASLLYWTATKSGLFALAPSNHDFYPINQIPKEYGVSIYYQKGAQVENENHNLYITNGFIKPVVLELSYNGINLTSAVYESIFHY